MSHTEINTSRLNELNQWLKKVLPETEYKLEPASSDASFRRYFRVTQQDTSWIVMDAPPAKEDTGPFITVAEFLIAHSVNVPEIHAKDTEMGFLLLSDLGSKQYLAELNNVTATKLYHSAIDELIQLQLSNTTMIKLPDYDAEKLHQEMSLFPEWYLAKHLNIDPPEFLDELFQLLINSALEQPPVFVHRDYHSRNLMYISDNKPGIIDFQDAVIGPISYDLVSLLRDCYIVWSDGQIASWIDYYFSQAQQKGLLPPTTSLTTFTRWFDFMGIQRHLKVLGIFSRLNYRDNKVNYMLDIPLTLKYVRQISGRYPELAELHQFVNKLPDENS